MGIARGEAAMTLEEAIQTRLAEIKAVEEYDRANSEDKKMMIAKLMANRIQSALGIEVDPNRLSVEWDETHHPNTGARAYVVGWRGLPVKGRDLYENDKGRVLCSPVYLTDWPDGPRLLTPIAAWKASRRFHEEPKFFEFNQLTDAILYATGEIK